MGYKMNSQEENLIAWVDGINAILDELKITDEEERARLRGIAASQMGKSLGDMIVARIHRETEEMIKAKKA
jgi:hypothetical protein